MAGMQIMIVRGYMRADKLPPEVKKS
jgi:hypothetical protein